MSETEIDKYLFNEMSEAEGEDFEDKFADDDAFFYEIAERENALVDGYLRGRLQSDNLARFERSLADLPARRDKIANAKIIHEFIADGRTGNKTITIAERTSLFSRIFSFGPKLQFASVTAILILALASTFLWTENRRLGSLDQELTASRGREADLVSKIGDESQTSSELTADLDAERRRREELEAEIARLRRTNDHPVNAAPQTTIAALVLPWVGNRGGSAAPVRPLKLDTGVTRVSIVASLPSDIATGDVASALLNGEAVAENVKTVNRGGEKSISFTVPAAKLKPERNELIIRDGNNAVVVTYIIAVTKTQ
ncbi:MAG TPA: hypothetical protein VMZ26_01665 [Pyrinomonadaceae bacterium]|nr:hypothetical protein [Pyrinomonadaceae bacterium]